MLGYIQLPCIIGIKPVHIDTDIPNANDVISYLIPTNRLLAYNIALDSLVLFTTEIVELFIYYNDINTLKRSVDIYPGNTCIISNVCMRLNQMRILYQLHLYRPNWCSHMRSDFFNTYCPSVFLGIVNTLGPDILRLCYIDAVERDNVVYLKLLVDNYGWRAIIPHYVVYYNAVKCLDYISGYLQLADIQYIISKRRWKLLYTLFRGYIFITILIILLRNI